MRVDCGQLDPGAMIRPVPGEWHPHISERLDHEELADWCAGRDAVYQLAALTVGARLAVVDMERFRRGVGATVFGVSGQIWPPIPELDGQTEPSSDRARIADRSPLGRSEKNLAVASAEERAQRQIAREERLHVRAA
jgi:hypothetical protein